MTRSLWRRMFDLRGIAAAGCVLTSLWLLAPDWPSWKRLLVGIMLLLAMSLVARRVVEESAP